MKAKDTLSKVKEKIIENIEEIKARIITYSAELGMYDEESYLYNEITDLLEDTENTYTLPELSMIIIRAKAVETQINGWLAAKGENSISLTWPTISV